MWSRESIKAYARDFLRKHYWKAFLVCLIVSLTGRTSTSNQLGVVDKYSQYPMLDDIVNKVGIEFKNPVLNFTIRKFGGSPVFYLDKGTFLFISIFFIVLSIMLGYALEVGRARFFLKGFKEDASIGNLFSTFNRKEYFSILKTQFLRDLYTILWTLLFIIPGIIKSYEYRLVPYILSEEPELSSNEAITKSRNMTDGHKWNMFVLDLSFIGWELLGFLFFGIGGIFVNPYKEATYSRLYNILSDDYGIDDDLVLE
ncbi:DUF975 family protein [Sporanaerobacter acetigenes]|uniref:DUF975 family protein n=1 Tax=Sporanaerobacter acetigenes TaxID=165813 RepID=UPI003323CA12